MSAEKRSTRVGERLPPDPVNIERKQRSPRCCHETGCTRSKPMLLRRGHLSGRWYLVTDYKTKGKTMEMIRRHDMTDEVGNAVIAEVLQAALDEGVSRAVLDKLAAKFGLHATDAKAVSP